MSAEYSCLIVEDSPMMRQLLVMALARLKNVRVTEADDGVDGLRTVTNHVTETNEVLVRPAQ